MLITEWSDLSLTRTLTWNNRNAMTNFLTEYEIMPMFMNHANWHACMSYKHHHDFHIYIYIYTYKQITERGRGRIDIHSLDFNLEIP